MSIPIVITNNPIQISYNSVHVSGEVTSDGGGTISVYGFCWSTNPNPTLSDTHSSFEPGVKPFQQNLSILNRPFLAEGTYHVRAYATNEDGTAYGADKTFTITESNSDYATLEMIGWAYNITSNSANANGIIIHQGSSVVIDRGICWSTTENPNLLNGDSSSMGAGIGEFVGNMTGLSADTVYYVRAYAVNSSGVSYSPNTLQLRTLKDESTIVEGGVKIVTSFYDINNNLFSVEIYRPNKSDYEYTLVYKDGNEPFVRRHNGGDKNSLEYTIIQGQDIDCFLYFPKEDIKYFNYLMDSKYQEYVLDYKDGSGNLIFRGYIKPENLTKRYEETLDYIEIKIPANDGLADLSYIEFKEDDELIWGTLTILEIIKKALTPIAGDVLNFGFKVQLNTYEAKLMSSNECVLNKVSVNTQSFHTGEDDQKTAISCFEVIERVLGPFNVLFKQENGYYNITNYLELDSYLYTFDWELTQQSRLKMGTDTGSNLLDITDVYYTPYIEQQKIHPLKYVDTIHENAYIENELLSQDFNDWTMVNWDSAFIDSDGILSTIKKGTGGFGFEKQYIESEPFYIPKTKENQYLSFVFKYRLRFVSTNYPMYFQIDIYNVDKDIWKTPVHVKIDTKLTDKVVRYESGTVDESGENPFRIYEPGMYKIRISIYMSYGVYSFIYLKWHYCSAKLIPLVNQVTSSITNEPLPGGSQRRSGTSVARGTTATRPAVGSDRRTGRRASQRDPMSVRRFVLKQENGYETFKSTLNFADGIVSDLNQSGVFFINKVKTEIWNSYDYNENAPIIFIYSKNIINNRQRYKNYLRCTIHDRNHTIKFNNILIIDGLYYVPIQFIRNYRTGELQLGLVEIITDQLSYDEIEEIPVDSIMITEVAIPPAILDGVHQVDHKLDVGDIIRYDPLLKEYVPGQADTPIHTRAIGIVSEVISDDVFKYISDGFIRSDSMLYAQLNSKYNFEIGEYYFLSPEDEGGLLKSAQLELGDIEQCVGYVTTKGFKVEIDARMIELPSAKTDMSVRGEGRAIDPITLVNDESTPAALKYYGTNDNGDRGYHSLLDFMPDDGREVQLRTSNNYVEWKYDDEISWTQLFKIPVDGSDGKEIELRENAGWVEWRYVDAVSWTQLFKIPSDGADGKEVELRENDGWVEWRYTDDLSWTQLFKIPTGGGGGGGEDLPELHLDFEEADDEFIYNVPYKMKFTSQTSENGDATLSIALNTTLERYDRLTITATAPGLVSLYGEYIS